MITSFHSNPRPGCVAAYLAATVAVLVGLLGATPASPAGVAQIYDTVACTYDASAPLSAVDTTTTAWGSPALPTATLRATHTIAGRCGLAAESGPDAQALLASIGQEGKTAGVLNIDGELTPLVSGKSSLGNYAASGHVEGQAALIMREQGVSRAELLMDNPNGICGYCSSQVPTLLPQGAELTVRTPLGTVPPSSRWFNGRTFFGNAADPKAWP